MNSINFKQKVVLVIASILFIASGLYPDWMEKVEWRNRDITETHHLGRYFILNPPYERGGFDLPKNQFINTTQLFIEWSIIVFPTIVLLIVLKNSSKE